MEYQFIGHSAHDFVNVLAETHLTCKQYYFKYYISCCHNTPSVPLTQYRSGEKIEKNEMGGACSAYVGVERRIQDFGAET